MKDGLEEHILNTEVQMEGADGIGNEGPMGLKQESWAWTTDNVP